MHIVIALLLASASAAFVAWPFFGQALAGAARDPLSEAQLSPLERQKLEAYAAIKEAEFDHQMGKLTEADFAMLRERYSQQAIAALTAIEQAGRATPIGRVADARKPARIAYCPSCGGAVPPRANFCHRCGRTLKEAVA